MNIKMLLDSGMMERRDLRSGRIYREGSDPEFGVIFTSHVNKTKDDLGLNASLLTGTFIGEINFNETDSEQFFEILGGYFYHDNYPDVGITTQVFGLALDPRFGIEEGGVKTLDNKWKLQDPEKPILNESYWSPRYGPHHGWTFIVTLKEREKFPTSENRLKIFAYCPEIITFAAAMGECQYDPQDNELKRNVIFQAQVDANPQKWFLDFCDGTTRSGDGAPPVKIDHLYKIKPDTPPRLCVQGQTACDEFCAEADLDDFQVCPQCPEITHIDITIGNCKTENGIRRRQVTFAVQIEGDAPKHWLWEFGDGSQKSGEGVPPPSIEHFYSHKPASAPKLCLIGPEPCRETCAEADIAALEECQPCPKITKIEHAMRDKDRESKIVEFQIYIEGRQPQKCEWNWGDGTANEATTTLTASHEYKRGTEGIARYTVNVKIAGPEDCQASDSTTIEIPEKITCPKILKIDSTIEDKNHESKIVAFRGVIEGKQPENCEWDWGDGSAPEITTAASATHEYAMLVSGPANYVVTLKTNGPEDCSATAQTNAEIPRKVICPIIKAIEAEIGKCVTEGTTRRRKVTFISVVAGDAPDRWTMEFGDGANESGDGMPPTHLEHFYEKKPERAPKLCLFGPEPCSESCVQVNITEFPQCQPCPKIIDIQTKIVEKSQESERILFTAAFEGRQPQQFVWQWGDGSEDEKTNSPSTTHSFRIPKKGANEYTVSVTSAGPEDCAGSFDTKIQIAARPKVLALCTLLPYLIGFLAALTLGTFILRIAGEIFASIQNYEWVSIPLIIFLLLTFFALVYWYRIRGKANCPKPFTCNWLGIGWVALLSGAIDAAYILNCCESWWWAVIVILLVFAAALFFRWLGKCNIKITRFLIHVLASLLASIIIYFLIAQRLIQNCLH